MTDLNKLREEFETLLNIHELMEKSSAEYISSDIYFTEDDYAFGYLNGAWYYYQEQQKKIDALKAQLDKAQKDSERIDFLADKDQQIANVQMPREIVERNLSSLRNAIDEAMALAAHGEKQ